MVNAIITVFTFVGLLVGVIVVPVHGGGGDWLRSSVITLINFGVWTCVAFVLLQIFRHSTKKAGTGSVAR